MEINRWYDDPLRGQIKNFLSRIFPDFYDSDKLHDVAELIRFGVVCTADIGRFDVFFGQELKHEKYPIHLLMFGNLQDFSKELDVMGVGSEVEFELPNPRYCHNPFYHTERIASLLDPNAIKILGERSVLQFEYHGRHYLIIGI